MLYRLWRCSESDGDTMYAVIACFRKHADVYTSILLEESE
jgi:hypothetical protein